MQSITGSDVLITINGTLIATAASLSYSVSRRKLPVYTFGSVDPKAIGRGVRLINGVLDSVVISGNSISKILNDTMTKLGPVFIADKSDIALYEQALRNIFGDGFADEIEPIKDGTDIVGYQMPAAIYLDQLPAVDIIMLGANEEGSFVKTIIRNASFVSQQMSIDLNGFSAIERVEFLAQSTRPMEEFAPTASVATSGNVTNPTGESTADVFTS